MNKTDKLNIIFNNKLLFVFIPLINPVITFINNRSIVWTRYDFSRKVWIHKENGITLSVDVNPNWNISLKTMAKAAKAVCCKYYFPKINDIVVDLGAGVGFETILFQRLVGEAGKVFAVEAHPKTASLLELCASKNGFGNVDISQIAIGGENGFAFIGDVNNHASNSICKKSENGIRIAVKTFDQFVSEKHIKKIDYLKINIEGSEEDAIRGMKGSIHIVENVAISCHDFLEKDNGDRIKTKVIDFLRKNNFVVKESDHAHVVRRSWIYGTNRMHG